MGVLLFLFCRLFCFRSTVFVHHMVEYAFTNRRRLTNRFSLDAKSCLFIAFDSAGVPCPDLKIHRLSRKQALRYLACLSGHLLSIAAPAILRAYADSEKDFPFLFKQIDEPDQLRSVME